MPRLALNLAREIAKLGPFNIIYNGKGGLPAVCWTLKDGVHPGFSLYDFADRLRTRGWQVPAYSMPPNRSDLVVQRILVRHGFSRDLGDLLLEDFCRTLEYFKQHPAATPMTEHESGGHTTRAGSRRNTPDPATEFLIHAEIQENTAQFTPGGGINFRHVNGWH